MGGSREPGGDYPLAVQPGRYLHHPVRLQPRQRSVQTGRAVGHAEKRSASAGRRADRHGPCSRRRARRAGGGGAVQKGTANLLAAGSGGRSGGGDVGSVAALRSAPTPASARLVGEVAQRFASFALAPAQRRRPRRKPCRRRRAKCDTHNGLSRSFNRAGEARHRAWKNPRRIKSL